jgi:hypothetical protein
MQFIPRTDVGDRGPGETRLSFWSGNRGATVACRLLPLRQSGLSPAPSSFRWRSRAGKQKVLGPPFGGEFEAKFPEQPAQDVSGAGAWRDTRITGPSARIRRRVGMEGIRA